MNDLTEKIIGAAIDVHRVLGPGLLELESTYEACMLFELADRGLRIAKRPRGLSGRTDRLRLPH